MYQRLKGEFDNLFLVKLMKRNFEAGMQLNVSLYYFPFSTIHHFVIENNILIGILLCELRPTRSCCSGCNYNIAYSRYTYEKLEATS